MIRRKGRLVTLLLLLALVTYMAILWITQSGSRRVEERATSGQHSSVSVDSFKTTSNSPGTYSTKLFSQKVRHTELPQILKYDTWSTDGAMEYLQKYNTHLNSNSLPITANPGNSSTITEWWQAAAMLAWYMRSPLRHQCNGSITYFGGWGICQKEPYTVKPPCLVYSFGIAYNFSFDDGIGKIGCEVRSFDPSMLNVTNHRRSPNVHFYRYGLSDRNTNSFTPDLDRYVKKRQTWQMRTLKYIVHELGHRGKTIDVLKIDIETSEWEVLDNLIETDMLRYVRHLLIEYHFFPSRPPKLNFVHYFHVVTRLRQLGFREYYKRPHSEFLIPIAYRHQGEMFYVNANFREDHKHISWD